MTTSSRRRPKARRSYSTTILIGTNKTRSMAGWVERRGFTTTVIERLFDAHTKRQPHEPAIALCGLNASVSLLTAVLALAARQGNRYGSVSPA
jgi:hypothetical protein